MKILAVEDEKEVADLLETELTHEGFEIVVVPDGNSIDADLNRVQPEVILLDQMLPGKKGWELIQEIRQDPRFAKTPIIVVTGMNSEEDHVRALDWGADDYVTKPFRIRELAARIRAVHRRAEKEDGAKGDVVTNGDLAINFTAHRVMLSGSEIKLTVTEFNILAELLKKAGQVVSRENLRQFALNNLNVTDRTIDVHMASLRKKLDHRGDSIQTVRGVGYRFSDS